MGEFTEHDKQPEVSREELERSIAEQVDTLWLRYGWRCQHEVLFRPMVRLPIDSIARAIQLPRSMDDPAERFVLAVYGLEQPEQRQRIQAIASFVVPHEVAHAVTGVHRERYMVDIPEEQFADLNLSKQVRPELYTSGANELATDVVAYHMAAEAGQVEQFNRALAATLQDDAQREQSGEFGPFYRDQARFQVLAQHAGVGTDETRAVLEFWRTTRERQLDVDDQRRYREMGEYLTAVAAKAEQIPLRSSVTDQSAPEPGQPWLTSTPAERVQRIGEFQRLQAEAKTEKERRWYQIMEEIESIPDGVGRGIDRNIKEGVAALMVLGFPTSGSCDGHGVAGPWIQVYAPEPDGWQESEVARQEWTEANEREAVRMRALLGEFYAQREVDPAVRIVMSPHGIFHAFRLESGEYIDLVEAEKNPGLNKVRAAQFTQEMTDFTDFLKQKYFREE